MIVRATGRHAVRTSSSMARAISALPSASMRVLPARKGTTMDGMSRGAYPAPGNAEIADRLEAFASLLDLAGANHYTVRAYRRAGELIRETTAPIAELVRSGRVRELRGIGPGIEARLRE